MAPLDKFKQQYLENTQNMTKLLSTTKPLDCGDSERAVLMGLLEQQISLLKVGGELAKAAQAYERTLAKLVEASLPPNTTDAKAAKSSESSEQDPLAAASAS